MRALAILTLFILGAAVASTSLWPHESLLWLLAAFFRVLLFLVGAVLMIVAALGVVTKWYEED